MARRAGVAVLGGTFDRLHAGHRALLDVAFKSAHSVGIGVTTATYLRQHPKQMRGRIEPFAVRRRALERYLRAHYPGRRFWTVPLRDPFGGSVDAGVDVLVASEESRRGARAVNVERRHRGLPPVRLVLVPVVRADDGLPISSTRIRAGFIDPDGHRRRAVGIGLNGVDESTGGTLLRALRAAFAPAGTLEVRIYRLPAHLPRSSGRALAEQRARDALPGAEVGVGVALTRSPSSRGWLSVADGSRILSTRLRVATARSISQEIGRLLRSMPTAAST
ncbi:MAG TPA: pantetheine-phosphate adenylyltransferase [Thermoplasmata archaeon]|nr:pantetheine-phosphate adenylyltransferase [Thermoplasmata archaeon]